MRMKEKISRAIRWLRNRSPEILLSVFLVYLLPLVYYVVREVTAEFHMVITDPREYAGRVANRPWPWIGALISLGGAALVTGVVWRAWKPLWAVARKMVIEALSRRVVLVLVVFFIVLMPSLPFLLHTEGTLKSQVQIVFTYSLVLAMVLLSLIAIFVSTASVCSEVERKYVQITDTKPLRRWQFLVGKLGGILVMCAALLFVMSGSVYGLVRYMSREQDEVGLTEWEAGKRSRERKQVREEVLVTRVPHLPVREDPDEVVQRMIKEVQKRTDRFDKLPDIDIMEKRLREEHERASGYVGPLNYRRWEVEGLEPREGDNVYVRFKFFPTSGSERQMCRGRWTLWAPVGAQQESEKAQDEERDKGLPVRPVGWMEDTWKSGVSHEIEFASETIAPNGVLRLTYHNLEPRTGVYFALEGGIAVLQKSEAFFPNYYRSLVVIFAQVGVLAALGLMAGALFSFPVATLTVFFVFVSGLVGPWLIHIMGQGVGFYTARDVPAAIAPYLNAVVTFIAKAIIAVMPHFTKFSPIGNLVNGEAVTWAFVGTSTAELFFIRGGIALLIGIYFYSRRELARVIK